MDQEPDPMAPSPAGSFSSPTLNATALAALAEAVYLVDAAGRITWANAAFARLTGYTVAEVTGQPSTRYYVPEDETLFVARRRLVQQGTPVAPRLDAVFIRKDGTQVPVELTVSSLLDGGHVAGRLTVLRLHHRPHTAPAAGAAPSPLGPAAHQEPGATWWGRALRRFGGQAAGVLAGGVGGLVLLGWAFGSQHLISLLPGWPAMVPNTALMLILAGLSLWWYHRHAACTPCGTTSRQPLAVLSAALVLLLGLLTLSQYVGGWDLGFDRWLFGQQLQRYSTQGFPGRMAVPTALSGVLLGGALLLVHGWGRRYLTLAHGGALAAAGIAWLALLGYVYHTTFYASPGNTGMAVHTALAVLLLSAGLLGAHPAHGLLASVVAPTLGGALVRRLLPAVVGLPVGLGLLRLWSEHAGLLTVPDGVAFLVVGHTLLLLGLVLYTARQLSALDTRRRQAEAALRQAHDTLERRVRERTAALAATAAAERAQRQQWQTTLASIGDAVIVTDAAGYVSFMNAVAAALTGWTAEEAAGQPLPQVFRIVNETTRQPADNPVTRVISEGAVVGLANHTVLLTRDGRETPIDDSAAPIRDAAGQLSGAVLVFRDIGARRQLEAKLQESQERVQLALHVARMFAFEWDLPTDAVRCSAARGPILGLSGAEAEHDTGQAYFRRVHPEDREPFVALLQRLRPEQDTYTTTYRVTRPDGDVVALEESARGFFDANGQLRRLIGMTADVTERRLAEEALRTSHEHVRRQLDELHTLYATAPVGLCVFSPEGRYLRLNDRLAEINGLPAAAHLGRTIREVVPALADQAEALLHRIVTTGNPVLNLELVGETAAQPGVQRTWLEHWVPQKDTAGEVVAVQVVAEEVTERKQAEAALQELTATLERRVAERTAALAQATAAQQRLEREAQRAEHFALLGRLAAGVSHELRNPLGAVFLNVDLLTEELQQPSPDSPEVVAEILAELKANLARVEDLVEDYLSLVRVNTLQRQVQDLGAACTAWVADFQAQATARGMQLMAEGLAELGPLAFHANTLHRALLNLVQNALDAMSPGGTVRLVGQGTADQVQLEVRDTGSGIPADQLARIFEPLHTTKPGGTGLGLYIVQEIIAAHGGRITVTSVVGQGTTFTLSLPRVTLQSTPAHAPLEEAYQ